MFDIDLHSPMTNLKLRKLALEVCKRTGIDYEEIYLSAYLYYRPTPNNLADYQNLVFKEIQGLTDFNSALDNSPVGSL